MRKLLLALSIVTFCTSQSAGVLAQEGPPVPPVVHTPVVTTPAPAPTQTAPVFTPPPVTTFSPQQTPNPTISPLDQRAGLGQNAFNALQDAQQSSAFGLSLQSISKPTLSNSNLLAPSGTVSNLITPAKTDAFSELTLHAVLLSSIETIFGNNQNKDLIKLLEQEIQLGLLDDLALQLKAIATAWPRLSSDQRATFQFTLTLVALAKYENAAGGKLPMQSLVAFLQSAAPSTLGTPTQYLQSVLQSVMKMNSAQMQQFLVQGTLTNSSKVTTISQVIQQASQLIQTPASTSPESSITQQLQKTMNNLFQQTTQQQQQTNKTQQQTAQQQQQTNKTQQQTAQQQQQANETQQQISAHQMPGASYEPTDARLPNPLANEPSLILTGIPEADLLVTGTPNDLSAETTGTGTIGQGSPPPVPQSQQSAQPQQQVTLSPAAQQLLKEEMAAAGRSTSLNTANAANKQSQGTAQTQQAAPQQTAAQTQAKAKLIAANQQLHVQTQSTGQIWSTIGQAFQSIGADISIALGLTLLPPPTQAHQSQKSP